MFDISWTEFLLIGVVALIVIGPKELPGGPAHDRAVDPQGARHGRRFPEPVPGGDARSGDGRPQEAGRRHRTGRQKLRSAQGRAHATSKPPAKISRRRSTGRSRRADAAQPERRCPVRGRGRLAQDRHRRRTTGPVAPEAMAKLSGRASRRRSLRPPRKRDRRRASRPLARSGRTAEAAAAGPDSTGRTG